MLYYNDELCVSGQILAEILTLEKISIPKLLFLMATRTYPPCLHRFSSACYFILILLVSFFRGKAPLSQDQYVWAQGRKVICSF